MHLKSLVIKGFKSFADTARIDFEPGVTVVVGPNGSGKSNVVDAITWVLGAQGPRAMRGQKMDDVIFAGTSERPALGRAEVSLTLDNSDGELPIEFTEVTITRTLFRSGDSGYAINNVPCRLLDIQELLSDTGVGRQQHVIVAQGQIDAVLSARSEDRRSVIEEAAGVLKYRKRKEKAERRLASTEANLIRLQDLLREVRRQLKPLARQAEAAQRHGRLVEELRALRLHLNGRELHSLTAKMTTATDAMTAIDRRDGERRARLAELDAALLEAEAALRSREAAGDDGDELPRLEALRERCRGLRGRVAERRRSVERDVDKLLDEAVVASLEADAAGLTSQLAEVDQAAAALVGDLDEVADQEAALDESRIELADDGLPVADLAAEAARTAAASRAELARLEAEVAAAEAEQARLDDRLRSDRTRHDECVAVLAAAEVELGAAAEALPGAVAAAERAAADLVAAETARQEAADRAELAGAEASAASATVDALDLALAQARSSAGADLLREVDGVLGSLLDLVDIERGAEAPVEAAIGEALRATVVADADGARRALSSLLAGEHTGAVLALGVARGGALPAAPIGEPVRALVRGRRPQVDALLDLLLQRAVLVRDGWEAASIAAAQHPDLVVVTPAGQRFSVDGWRVGGDPTGATGAALDEARAAHERAEQAADDAREALLVAAGRRSAAVEADKVAAATAARATRRVEADEATVASTRSELEGAATRMAAVDGESQALTHRLTEGRQRLEVVRVETKDATDRAAELEIAAADRRSAHDRFVARERAVVQLRSDLEVRAAGIAERRELLRTRLEAVETRLARYADERVEAQRRRLALETDLRTLDRMAGVLTVRGGRVETLTEAARERHRARTERSRELLTRIDTLRKDRTAEEKELEADRERKRRAELDATEARLRIEQLTATLRDELGASSDDAIAAPLPALPEGTSAPVHLKELERELRVLGPVNPLALQEHAELTEREEFLGSQLDDVRRTRRELGKVISAVDAEIMTTFAAAFADVQANFERLFERLFPGGTGKLALSDPGDLLGTGIEIEAKPSGKNVRKLSLLSGGERSLTAMAFLFSVFRSRPSPFYVLDEVEAALDDLNLSRFLSLIEDFRGEAQLLLVSHQKRTMEAADALIGVSMQAGGSSKVVSERTERAA
ncbi:MAG: chromosome segregation protein SMC [Actinomycetota bacterium]